MLKPTVVEYSINSFDTLVQESLSEIGISVSEPVKNYLCELLQSYIYTDTLFSETNNSKKKHIQTLAELYLQSHSSKKSLKNNLKKIGDSSLYMVGFFMEFLNRKTVSVDYYMSMGKQAYQDLSCFQNKDLFQELSGRFSDLVFVLFQIRTKNSKNTYKELLILLDQYKKINSSEMSQGVLNKKIGILLQKKKQSEH